MDALLISLAAFAVIFSGALVGLALQSRLPSHHLSDRSRDAIKMGAGLISMMAALVLSLLINSATGVFRDVSQGLTVAAARVILLDQLLVAYGPETESIRAELRTAVARALEVLDPATRKDPHPFEGSNALLLGRITDSIRVLEPSTPIQRSLQPRAVELSQDLLDADWTLVERGRDALPVLFLVVMLFWLFVLNLTYGLAAPANGTVLAILLVCALSVAAAVFLIKELAHPLDGMIRVSDAPLRNALERISAPGSQL